MDRHKTEDQSSKQAGHRQDVNFILFLNRLEARTDLPALMFCFLWCVFLLLFLTDNKMKGFGKTQSCNSDIIRHAPMFGGNWLMLFSQCSGLRSPSLRYTRIKLPLEMPLLFQSPCGLSYCFLEKEISKRLSHVMDGYNSTSHLSEHALRTS